MHGVVGGALSMAQGGGFWQGFASNAIGAGTGLVSNSISGGDVFLDTAIVGAAGGVSSILTGGKFAAGFITAAFANLYNKYGRIFQYAGGGFGAAGGGILGFVTGLVTDGPLAALAEGLAGGYYGYRYGSIGGRIIGETLDIVLSENQEDAGDNPNRMTPDQEAVKDLADEATNGGRKPLSKEDAETILDWAEETDYPGRRAGAGDVSNPSNWDAAGGQPHIHLPGAGRNGHVPVQDGVTPR